MTAAIRRTEITGAAHVAKAGCIKYWAKVSAVIAFPVGTKISKATHKYKNPGKGPNA
jgi:hypothetical protein